jgi:hypothetical protein
VNAPSVRFPGRLAAEVAYSFAAPASQRFRALRQPLLSRSASPAVGRSASFGAGRPRFAGQRTVGASLSRLKTQGLRQSQSLPRDRARRQKLRVLLSFPIRSASRTVVAMHCEHVLSTGPAVTTRLGGVGWRKQIALVRVELSVRPVSGSGSPIRPNPSIERTSKTLRVSAASHVKR